MKLNFTTVTLNNFKSYYGLHTFDLGRVGHGITYMRGDNQAEPRLGPNGAGKTSLWDAMTWCLYGSTAGGLRTPDIRPWQDAGPTSVTVGVKVDGEDHMITRSTSPNRLLLNGKECGQEEIVRLIGIEFAMFTNTILLGQGRPLFFDLRPQEKMDLLSDALSLERWDTYSDRAKDMLRKQQEDATKLQQRFDRIDGEWALLLDQIKDAKKAMTAWERGREDARKGVRAERDAAMKVLTAEENKLNALVLKYDGMAMEAKALRTEIDELRQDQIAAERELATASEKEKTARKEATKLADDLDDMRKSKRCPMCNQPITKKDVAGHIKEITVAYDKACIRHDKATATVKLRDRDLMNVKLKLERATESGAEFLRKADEARDGVDYLTPVVAELRAKHRALSDRYNEQDAEKNPSAVLLKKLRKDLSDAELDMDDIERDIVKNQRVQSRAKFWVKGFKEVRLMLLEEVLADFQLILSGMLEDIGLERWRVSANIEKENKNGNLKPGLFIDIRSPVSKKGGGIKWESWSGGEGQRLRVVGALALAEVLLNQVGVQSNIEILDEPTRHMSREGVQDVCLFLRDRGRQRKMKVFYADHQVLDTALFDQVVTVVRDSKGSRFKLEHNAWVIPNEKRNPTKGGSSASSPKRLPDRVRSR